MKRNKPIELSRRTFLRRAGLLVSGLGLSATVQSNLLDAISRKAVRRFGREALAQSAANPVRFLIEIEIFAGHQFNTLFASPGHRNDVHAADLNFYSSNSMVVPYLAPGTGPKPLYITTYPEDGLRPGMGQISGGQALLNALAAVNTTSQRVGIATCESLLVPDPAHRTNFIMRSPNTSAPVPSILHATTVQARTPVQAIHWKGGPVEQPRGEVNGLQLASLAEVRSADQFEGLVRPLPTYFTQDEFKVIAGAFDQTSGDLITAGAIDSLDQAFLIEASPDAADVYATRSKPGRNQAMLDRITQVRSFYEAQAPKFANLETMLDGAPLQQGLNYALACFAAGVTTTFSIDFQESDWHPNIPEKDTSTSIQGQWNAFLGNGLAGLLLAAAELDDPHGNPGDKIIDSLLINITSEFTRTPTILSGRTDNGDGGSAGGVMIGSRVQSGAYGNVTGSGLLESFDRGTGVVNGLAAQPTQAMWYKASLDAMGLPKSLIDGIVPMPSDPFGGYIPTMVRG